MRYRSVVILVKPNTFRFAALAAIGGMLLIGCSNSDQDQPDTAPTEEATTTASPSAPEVDLDQYAAALVTNTELMGVAQDPPVEGFVDDPVTMYLTLSEFEPSGRCATLLDELNSFTAPAVGGISARFIRDAPDTVDAAEPHPTRGAAVETRNFETAAPSQAVGMYRRIPNAAGALRSSDGEGAEATFTKVPGLDAIHLEISDGEASESLAVGGSSVNARFHVYMTAEQVTLEEAQDMFGAQAEKLQETFRDRGTPSPDASSASEEPTDDPT